MIRPLVLALAALLPASAGAADPLVVTGTASYRERIMVPPDTVFEARLEDVSLADAPAVVLAEQIVEAAGGPPYAIRLEVDPALIDDRARYTVRASLRLGDRLLFTTDTHTPVLTRGAGNAVEIMMVRVGS